jgi:hypothetical protein
MTGHRTLPSRLVLAAIFTTLAAAGCGGAPIAPSNDQTTVTVSPPSSASPGTAAPSSPPPAH